MDTKALNAIPPTTENKTKNKERTRKCMLPKANPLSSLQTHIRSYSVGIAAHLLPQPGAIASFAVRKHWLPRVTMGKYLTVQTQALLDLYKYHPPASSVCCWEMLCSSALMLECPIPGLDSLICYSLDSWLGASVEISCEAVSHVSEEKVGKASVLSVNYIYQLCTKYKILLNCIIARLWD